MTGEVTAIRENGAASGIGVLGTYAYDELGRRTSLTRGNGVVTTYDYDALSRLESLSNDLASTGSDQTVGLSYNPASQITSRSNSNSIYAPTQAGTAKAYTPNGLNQITSVSGTSLTYDGRGNLTSDGTVSYTYDLANRLLTAGTYDFLYDGAGRILRSDSGTTINKYLYDGADMIAEYNSSIVMRRRYVHGPGSDEPLTWYEGTGTTDRRWYVADERGSVVAVTNATGASTATNTYDEYGVPAATNTTRFQYTGQVWFSGLPIYHYKARQYHPALGRFLQADPVGYDQGMNLYAYVRNDPVNLVDPSGMFSIKAAVLGFMKKFTGDPDKKSAPDGNSEATEVEELVVTANPLPEKETQPRPVDWSIREGISNLISQLPTVSAWFHGRSHEYTISQPTECPADDAFNMIKQPGMSAPGAPAAVEGTSTGVRLLGGNPITQVVNSQNRTITNNTEGPHEFHPGSVSISIVSRSGGGSTINVVGTGSGGDAMFNDVAGLTLFGNMAALVAASCAIGND